MYKRNGDTSWQDAVVLERKKLNEYPTFKDIGVGTDPTKGYKG